MALQEATLKLIENTASRGAPDVRTVSYSAGTYKVSVETPGLFRKRLYSGKYLPDKRDASV